ncbi:NAD(P)-dependent oxidoreductase [Saccharibacillus sp. JS10]|uniref:NAD(P)-dependent oxidoreductase n=1 Tax=Saccharibacillus sp. JS10 TaxID=2950552 RepID=UPI00210DA9E1|nr:SDR family oxidoreductase [Saccharibacillus sp. JS10]MCQ4087347.1 SDR family oxidoreductase [Saccharibacillus sp. JS10]
MRMLILGATGRVGSVMTKLAIEDGHDVTVLVRDPSKVSEHENLTILQGDACRAEDIQRAVTRNDVVVSALNTGGATTLSDSIPLIIEAMENSGIRRVVTIGTAGILQSRAEPHLLRYQSSESKRKLTRAAEEHEIVYQQLQASALDWTIVCPTYLPDGEAVGNYRTEADRLPEGGDRISVGDTAEFAYREIGERQYVGARVGIAY